LGAVPKVPARNNTSSLSTSRRACSKAVVQVLIQYGDELTRANVMKQAANLDFYNDVILPGVRVKTGPINQFQMMRFKDGSWQGFGPLLGAD
jgi:branched-chain amino acid transport system substrate-binding protein